MFSAGVYISGTEQKLKLKFSMQTYLTHLNSIFEYYHASVNLDREYVLHLEDENVYRPVLKNKTATMCFCQKNFSSFGSLLPYGPAVSFFLVAALKSLNPPFCYE